jgi:hypothetical protein
MLFTHDDPILVLDEEQSWKLLTINENVLFEADGITSEEAWSVVVKGTARVLTLSQEIADAEALNLKTWVPTFKDFYVEIKPSRISGRHFNFGEQPERF